MATVSGACVISRVSGLLQIREDTIPSKLIWKAIDQDKSLEITLNTLDRLQATPATSPKMLLKLFYKEQGTPDIKDIKLTFNNRQTMDSVKETLQAIVARQKAVVKDTPTPSNGDSARATPAPAESESGTLTPVPGDPLDFSSRESLTDAALIKNHQLQKKYLELNKSLFNVFKESVIKLKLSPVIFWLSRVGLLRTYALTISQHRGPYNVLSTIRPVASSDNKVDVKVTRDQIGEIFETYPIVKRAYDELVPLKFTEGEFFWRFFNSKLFMRLKGNKINTVNTKGDVVIDKYLHVDADFVEDEENAKSQKTPGADGHPVNKFIDLLGNEVDNSQKLGLSPDFTMKFSDEDASKVGSLLRNEVRSNKHENEMVILMRNMNKLSNKMVTTNSTAGNDNGPENTTNNSNYQELEDELDIADLNEAELLNYVELNLDTQAARHVSRQLQESAPVSDEKEIEQVKGFLSAQIIASSDSGINLKETYSTKAGEITKASSDITGLVKHNFRIFKSLHNVKDPQSAGENILPEADVQELITFNMTAVEFLLHFWNLYLNGGSPVQLRKLFTNLRNCQTSLANLEKKLIEHILNHELVQQNERLREKLQKDLENCIFPMRSGLNKACDDYMAAVRAANEMNENGKRPHDEN